MVNLGDGFPFPATDTRAAAGARLAALPIGSPIVVDATNQFAEYAPVYRGYVDLGEETGSEWVARHLPGATIIKAFNAMYASYVRPDPHHRDGRQVVFYAGDDNTACADFDQLIGRLGFAPVRVGGLRDGGKLMQLGEPLSTLHVIKQD